MPFHRGNAPITKMPVIQESKTGFFYPKSMSNLKASVNMQSIASVKSIFRAEDNFSTKKVLSVNKIFDFLRQAKLSDP